MNGPTSRSLRIRAQPEDGRVQRSREGSRSAHSHRPPEAMGGRLTRPIRRGILPGLALALLLSLAPRSLATVRAAGVRYAAPTARGSGDCSSWANACTLPTALSGATPGDQIWVQAGVHKPGSDQGDSFGLKSGVAIYGGFAGTETALGQRNPTAHLTVLSGDIDNNDVVDANGVTMAIVGGNSYHVVTANGVDATAVLDGFIITGGQANGTLSGTNVGGGMYAVNSHPTLAHLIFRTNVAKDYGGGMYNAFSNPTLTHVTFISNSATFGGGGIYNASSSPTLTHAIFISNTADYGGGMHNDRSHPTLINVVFRNNTARNGGGGGMSNSQSNPMLIHVTFYGNTATSAGGAMDNIGSNPTVRNSILWGNSSLQVYNLLSSTPTFSYSDLQGCGGSGGTWNAACGADGGGNIAADPLFVDAPNGDLHLRAGSPAINAGHNAFVPPDVTTDLAGNPRIVGGRVDMGAYEFVGYSLFLPLVERSP